MAQLTLTLNTNPNGTSIFIIIEVGGVPLTTAYEVFVDSRFAANRVEMPLSLPDTFVMASNLVIAWNLDYANWGGVNNAIATQNANEVIITFLNPSWQVTSVTGDAISGGDVSFLVDNPPIEEDVSIVLDSFTTPGSNFCTEAVTNLIVEGGNDLYNVYELPSLTQVKTSVSSPIALDTARGTNVNYRITDTTGFLIGEILINTPRKIISEDISVVLLNLTSGTTLTINVVHINSDILPLTYSLDDITYESENIFTGLAPNTYTIYVKDDWGCVSSTTVVVDGTTTITETIAIISEINALHFALIEDGKKNYKNTLSCDELKPLTYPYFHRYILADIIPTQFKTNAKYINIYGIDGDGVQTPISEIQKTENTGLQAKSTSTYFNLGNGRSGIFFGVVDLLDYDTEAILESTNFGFTLPEWANEKGDIVLIEGIGEIQVDSVGYSDLYQAFVLEFNITYTGVAVEKIISAIYNLQPYEVYEFNTFMNAMPELFNIVIEFGVDSGNITHQFISEKIKRFEDNDRYFDIDYSDPENKGHMVYQTGISHKIRLEGIQDYLGEQETEGYNGDTDFFVTDNTVFRSIRYTFFRLSSEMLHKLRLIFPHKTLIINGISHKIAEIPEIKTDINNNYKTFSITLKTGGNEFLTTEQEEITGTAEADSIAGAIESSQGKALVLWTKNNG